MFWLAWCFFDLLGLYLLVYTFLFLADRYKQIAIDKDVFEVCDEMKKEFGCTTSDVLSAALKSLKRDLARRSTVRG